MKGCASPEEVAEWSRRIDEHMASLAAIPCGRCHGPRGVIHVQFRPGYKICFACHQAIWRGEGRGPTHCTRCGAERQSGYTLYQHPPFYSICRSCYEEVSAPTHCGLCGDPLPPFEERTLYASCQTCYAKPKGHGLTRS